MRSIKLVANKMLLNKTVIIPLGSYNSYLLVVGTENGDVSYLLRIVMGRWSLWDGGGTEGRSQPVAPPPPTLGRCSDSPGLGPD